jgi:ribulose-5-phosphate 4-epimerase/fuculose-1-phosphate aldolase
MSDVNTEELKLMVVKAIRMLENIGLLDMNGHVSCRIPDSNHFLINNRKASRASLSIADIVMCDLDANLLEGSSEPPSEKHIHTEIYKVRPDVHAIIHNHPHYQTVLGIADIPMQPVFGIGAFVSAIPTYEKASLVNTAEMGKELAQVLADGYAVQLRNHGTVVVGDDVKSAFARSYFMEENAKKQYDAALINKEIKVIEGENLIRTIATAWVPSVIQKAWTYHEEKAIKSGAMRDIVI